MIDSARASFDPSCFEALAIAEERHFWFRVRNEVIATLASQCRRPAPGPLRVLEVGCGNGNVLATLRKVFPGSTLVGIDLLAEGLHFAHRRTDAHLVQAGVGCLPLRGPFDGIGAFDVIEHVDDDGLVLSQLRELLVPGGWLLVTVPAKRWLWSQYDVEIGHRRRYERDELQQRLEEAGFSVEYLSYFMASILPLVWASRTFAGRSRRPEGDGAGTYTEAQLRVVPGLNRVLHAVLSREATLIAKRWSLPVGTSLVAVATARAAGP